MITDFTKIQKLRDVVTIDPGVLLVECFYCGNDKSEGTQCKACGGRMAKKIKKSEESKFDSRMWIANGLSGATGSTGATCSTGAGFTTSAQLRKHSPLMTHFSFGTNSGGHR